MSVGVSVGVGVGAPDWVRKWQFLKISFFWPKIILKRLKNDKIEEVGHNLLNALYKTLNLNAGISDMIF